jgi:hypothetical protein
VKILRLDDPGENYVLEKECKQQNSGIKFEYSKPCTPQRNGIVEQTFQTLYDRILAMTNDSEIYGDFRDWVWTLCASKATYYDNLSIKKDEKTSPIELMLKT